MRTSMFPDPKRTDMSNPCPEFGWPTFVNHVRSRSVAMPEHWGPLSIKCAFTGKEIYETGRERYEVGPASYLILNTGQSYSSMIASKEETESFVVFFRPSFVEEVLTCLITPDDLLLDDPDRMVGRPVSFFEGLHAHDKLVTPVLQRLRVHGGTPIATPGWYEEQFHLLLERLLQQHRGVIAQVEGLNLKRCSTRIETYRRLQRARDYMDAHFQRGILLGDIAREAYMAPHHFLRLFKQAFQVSPHEYVTLRRLELAQKLLRTTDLPITTVCLEIGFESLGSFSSLFSRRFGVSPNRYRRDGKRIAIQGHEVAA